MDGNTARWMQLKRLTPRELTHFHALERESGYLYGFTKLADGTTAARAASFLVTVNEKLGSYWHRNKTEEDRANEVKAFERHVFPLWRPLLDQNSAPDLAALHEADRAICRDDYAINYEAGRPMSSSAARQVLA